MSDARPVSGVPVAYRISVTDYDTTQRVRTCTAAEADALLDVAILDDDQLSIAHDRSGRITLTRTLTGPRTATDPTMVTKHQTTVLTPVHPPRLADSQYTLLAELHAWNNDHPSRGAKLTDSGRITFGFTAAPPAVVRRLVAGGWVALASSKTKDVPFLRATVSYAGRIAMVLHEHRTRGNGIVNHEPDWRIHPGNPVYIASCTCGWYGPTADDAAITRGHARNHRHEQLQAIFPA
ncbi:hypothetical protein [Streptomyces noursei]|uniref:Uncharacterized protein n=1 Tax=Streptomyces noursei TaxID=1971 RepID=A0A2N8PQX7_STRNR|nr:hypothetical protein [Streptomyces noursei]PNE43407.1 hypothetical protein AOB60_00210 [Streptomyces noursei]